MKVYRAIAYGSESTGFIIGAKSINEAIKLAIEADYGNVDIEEVWEVSELQTTQTTSEIILQF